MNEKLKELETKLSSDETLAAKYKETLLSAEKNGAKSDSEALSAAAAAVGIEITPEEIERAFADKQELSEDDLSNVSGGAIVWDEDLEEEVEVEDEEDEIDDSVDEFGHDAVCLAAWHCLAGLRHTSTNSHVENCWSNYNCLFSSQNKAFDLF